MNKETPKRVRKNRGEMVEEKRVNLISEEDDKIFKRTFGKCTIISVLSLVSTCFEEKTNA